MPPPPPPPKLRVGQHFVRWTITQRLGSGAFGEVFKITDVDGQNYALKTERVDAEHSVLVMDCIVLRAATSKNFKHFCRLIDTGRYRNDFLYVVMTLVGRSLHDLRKARQSEHFSMGTAIGVAIQTLEAIEELHSIGYLHRDIKPGNYSIGLAERREQRRIFILDFGMCRRYVHDDGSLRRPREAAGFRGTPRYAPLRCHLNAECCRADDVESWVYMAVEITTADIPWKRLSQMHEIANWKQRVHQRDPTTLRLLFRGCPPEYAKILDDVMTLKFYDTPNYSKYYKLLRQAFTTMNKCTELPYDWEREG